MTGNPQERPDDLRLTRRQEEILLAAVELLREEGLGGLTVRRLAERIGFSEAALYRHFASKEEVLVALMARLSEERLLTPMRRLAEDPSRPAAERLERTYEHQLDTLFDLDGVPMLFLAETIAGGDEALVAQARKVAGTLFGLYTRLLGEARGDAAAGDGERGDGELGDGERGDGGEEPGAGTTPADLAPVLVGYVAATAVRMRLGRNLLAEAPLDRRRVLRTGRYLVRRLVGGEAEGAAPGHGVGSEIGDGPDERTEDGE